MRRVIHRVVPLLVFCVAISACALKKRSGTDTDMVIAPSIDDAAQAVLWREPTRLDLTYKHAQGAMRWRMTFAGDGMRRIELLDVATGAPNGELILVDGRTLLTRAVNTARNDVLEIVDDAMLSQQIATALLQQALPTGPAGVSAARKINVEDSGEPISAETSHTSRIFYPPWTVRGSARRIDADRVEFDMAFVAQINSAVYKEARLALAGMWHREAAAPKLPDDFPLSGWSVWRIRIGTRDAGGISTAGYITTPESRRYATLGDLRAATRPSQ